MKKKLLYILLALLIIGFLFWEKPTSSPKLNVTTFNNLPGWGKVDLRPSLDAFKLSCKALLKQNAEKNVGSQQIIIRAHQWKSACNVALSSNFENQEAVAQFFKDWFVPVEFNDGKPVKGLFTGYYVPVLHGSKVKTTRFSIPLYQRPGNLITLNPADFGVDGRLFSGRLSGQRIVPYYTRKEIDQGKIDTHAEVLVWVDNAIDRLFLEIQGSGIVKLDDGQTMYVGYDSENGAAYTAIGRVMVERGLLSKDHSAMQDIRAYFEAHPEQMASVFHENKSFVFFRELTNKSALGSQGVALTPGYSLAVDRKWIPMGMPIWLTTSRPDPTSSQPKSLQRLMIAQDAGGAIKGMVRGDVFWGDGDEATYIAGKMKNEGRYWLLLPKISK